MGSQVLINEIWYNRSSLMPERHTSSRTTAMRVDHSALAASAVWYRWPPCARTKVALIDAEASRCQQCAGSAKLKRPPTNRSENTTHAEISIVLVWRLPAALSAPRNEVVRRFWAQYCMHIRNSMFLLALSCAMPMIYRLNRESFSMARVPVGRGSAAPFSNLFRNNLLHQKDTKRDQAYYNRFDGGSEAHH